MAQVFIILRQCVRQKNHAPLSNYTFHLSVFLWFSSLKHGDVYCTYQTGSSSDVYVSFMPFAGILSLSCDSSCYCKHVIFEALEITESNVSVSTIWTNSQKCCLTKQNMTFQYLNTQDMYFLTVLDNKESIKICRIKF